MVLCHSLVAKERIGQVCVYICWHSTFTLYIYRCEVLYMDVFLVPKVSGMSIVSPEHVYPGTINKVDESVICKAHQGYFCHSIFLGCKRYCLSAVSHSLETRDQNHFLQVCVFSATCGSDFCLTML
jgi:hypothetical protein